jgi:hypothetical protein
MSHCTGRSLHVRISIDKLYCISTIFPPIFVSQEMCDLVAVIYAIISFSSKFVRFHGQPRSNPLDLPEIRPVPKLWRWTAAHCGARPRWAFVIHCMLGQLSRKKLQIWNHKLCSMSAIFFRLQQSLVVNVILWSELIYLRNAMRIYHLLYFAKYVHLQLVFITAKSNDQKGCSIP